MVETILPLARLGSGITLFDGRIAALIGEFPAAFDGEKDGGGRGDDAGARSDAGGRSISSISGERFLFVFFHMCLLFGPIDKKLVLRLKLKTLFHKLRTKYRFLERLRQNTVWYILSTIYITFQISHQGVYIYIFFFKRSSNS